MLAPVAALYGANLNAYKVLAVFLFLISLLVVSQLFSNDLSKRNLWICLAVVGFSPVYWEVKDGIASEHLFLPLWYATLLVADDWYRRQKVYGNQFMHGAILGGLIFLTCATRTVGVVLLPMIVACEVLIARRVTRIGMCALATAVALLLVVRLILPSSGAGYLEQLQGISISSVVANAYADTTSFSLIWKNGHWDGIRRIAGAGFALLAIVGFLESQRDPADAAGDRNGGVFCGDCRVAVGGRLADDSAALAGVRVLSAGGDQLVAIASERTNRGESRRPGGAAVLVGIIRSGLCSSRFWTDLDRSRNWSGHGTV